MYAGYYLVQRDNRAEGSVSASIVLKADYTKSAGQVYQECTEFLFQERLGLRTISLVETHEVGYYFDSREYPSWVPDFAKALEPTPLWTLGRSTFSTFDSTSKNLHYAVDGHALDLQGAHWDEILFIGESVIEYSTGKLGNWETAPWPHQEVHCEYYLI